MGIVKAECDYCDHVVEQEDVGVDSREAALLIVCDSMKDHVRVNHEEKWKEDSDHYDVVTDFD